jgi:hypothetical protein
MEVPERFQGFYEKYVLILLLKTIYGLKQAAMAFWRELWKALADMDFKKVQRILVFIFVGQCMDWWSGYLGLMIVWLLKSQSRGSSQGTNEEQI